MSAAAHKVKVVATKPFEGQKPGTSGLRKPVPTFQKPHYTENFVQSCLEGAFPNILNPASAPPSPPPDAIALVVGGDGRLLTTETTQLICSIAAANGISKLIIGQNAIFSTPAVSCQIRKRSTRGGIILTASHNPGGEHGDFGIKCNMENGGPAPEGITDKIYEISTRIAQYRTLDPPLAVPLDQLGTHTYTVEHADGKHSAFTVEVIDSVNDYVHLLRTIFDFDALRSLLTGTNGYRKFNVLFDSMNGVTGPYVRRILCDELGAPPTSALRSQPLPDFGGHHPDPNLKWAHELVERITSDSSLHFAAAFDGDGDRNMILGQGGFFVTPSDSLAVIAEHCDGAIPYFKQGGGIPGFARSMPTSAAVDRVAAARGKPIYETPTGWKFFGNLMDSKRIALCGEESFGTGSDHIREKDGIWAALAWLQLLATRKGQDTPRELVHQLWHRYGRHFYARYDYENCDSAKSNQMMDTLEKHITAPGFVGTTLHAGAQALVVKTGDNFKYVDPVDASVSARQGLRVLFEDGSRIVYRLSGTGSTGATIRVYLEQYAPPPPATPADVFEGNAQKALEGIGALAVQLARIQEFTERKAPDVIT